MLQSLKTHSLSHSPNKSSAYCDFLNHMLWVVYKNPQILRAGLILSSQV